MSQGKTLESALRDMKEAVSAYLAAKGHKRRKRTEPALTTVIEV